MSSDNAMLQKEAKATFTVEEAEFLEQQRLDRLSPLEYRRELNKKHKAKFGSAMRGF